MITTVLKNLPPFVRLQGVTFQLIITVGENRKATMAYIITDVHEQSKHYSFWKASGGYWMHIYKTMTPCKWLVMREDIGTEMALRTAIRELKDFIHAHIAEIKT